MMLHNNIIILKKTLDILLSISMVCFKFVNEPQEICLADSRKVKQGKSPDNYTISLSQKIMNLAIPSIGSALTNKGKNLMAFVKLW